MVNFLMAYVGSAVARSREAGLSPLEWTVYRPRRTRAREGVAKVVFGNKCGGADFKVPPVILKAIKGGK